MRKEIKLDAQEPQHGASARSCRLFLYTISLVFEIIGFSLLVISKGAERNVSLRVGLSMILLLSCFFFDRARARAKMSSQQIKKNPPEKTPTYAENQIEVVHKAEEEEVKRLWTSRKIAVCRSVGWDLLPFFCFIQMVVLFVNSASEESEVDPFRLPWTTVIGMATGASFGICVRAEFLQVVARICDLYRGELVYLELGLFYFSISQREIPTRYPLLFAAIASSFWCGYNLQYVLITRVLHRTSSQPYVFGELVNSKQAYFPNIRGAVMKVIIGISLFGLSLWILQLPQTSSDGVMTRDLVVLLFASLGSYALAFPLGAFCGRLLPYRHYRLAFAIATYLLIPFASPNLTLPHFGLLCMGGICGGVADFINQDQYKRQIVRMRQQKQRTDKILRESQGFAEFLAQLQIPDIPLIQEQQKRRKMTLFLQFNGIMVLFFFVGLGVFEMIRNSWSRAVMWGIATVGSVLMYIFGFHLLPRWAPSVYSTTPMSLAKQIIYQNSFMLAFAIKIVLTLIMRKVLQEAKQNEDYPYANVFTSVLELLVLVPTISQLMFRRLEGYLPYVPCSEHISQLETALKLEASQVSEQKQFFCSYQLLKFMQQNPPFIVPAVMTSFSQSEIPSSSFSTPTFKLDIRRGQESSKNVAVEEQMKSVGASEQANDSGEHEGDSCQIVPSWQQFDLARCDQGMVLGLVSGNNKLLTLVVDFAQPYDQAFLSERLDITTLLQAVDAGVRGTAVARQFSFHMSEIFSLSPNVTSFNF